MFEARMAQAGVLKGIVEAIRDLVNEAVIDVGPSGLSLQALDASHVCLISVELALAAFEAYAFDGGGSVLSLGVPIGNLAKMLKCASNEDSVTLRSDGGGGDVLHIGFETPGDSVGQGSRRSS
jgi:proliferating cell nuclear antigen